MTAGAAPTAPSAPRSARTAPVHPTPAWAQARKSLLLQLPSTINGQPLDNVEGMTLGPTLPDGRQSVLLVSDNNFTAGQASQVLLLALG